MEQRKFDREEVCTVFDISPPFMEILDRATFNNVEELRDVQFRDSIGPKIESLAGDYGFDETVNRAVGVHSAALTEALEKIYGARRVVDELKGGK